MTASPVDEAVPFALPLTRRFRGTELREGMLLRVGTTWGEWAPFPEYDDATAARWLAGALEAARGELADAAARPRRGQRDRPALTDLADVTARVLDAVATDGCTVVKVKVAEPGQTLRRRRRARRRGARRARRRRRRERPHPRRRQRRRGASSEAAQRLAVLDDLAGGLEYAEQPCATIADLAALREHGTGVRIAVDEGVRLAGELDDAAVDADPRRGRRPRAQGDPARRRTPVPRPRRGASACPSR